MKKKVIYYRKSIESLIKVRRISLPEEDIVVSLTGNQSPLPMEFSLLVWNIFKSQGGEDFFDDLAQLSEDSDIVCLQEVLRKDKPQIGQVESFYNYVFASSYTRSDGHCDGVLTACRFAIGENAVRIPSIGKEPIANTPKVALLTFIPTMNGELLALINLHSILFRSIQQSERELKHVLNQLHSFEGPALLVGDLNTFTSKYLRRAVNIMLDYGFVLADPPRDPRSQVKCLDHVFCRGLSIREVRVLADIRSSDHLPIRARFSLKM